LINTTTTVHYYAETSAVINIHNHHIENTVLENAIKNLDVGIIAISFGSVFDQTYSNAITTHVRFAKENLLMFIEESSLGVKI
jgi:hypothetical protein